MTDPFNIKTMDAVKDGDELLNLLNSGAMISMIVTGFSMLPFLQAGRDTVLLKKTESLKRGQILFFRRRSGLFVLHRIRKILPDGRILVNGDAQVWCEIVMPDQVAAVVLGIVRDGRSYAADSFRFRVRNALWYPTRPIRPFIFRVFSFVQRLLHREG